MRIEKLASSKVISYIPGADNYGSTSPFSGFNKSKEISPEKFGFARNDHA